MSSKYVIAIGMPIARAPQPETMDCLLAAMADLRKEPSASVHLFDPVGYQVDNARNLITQEALKIPGLTHIMWIDDDMTFEPTAIRRLLDHDLPVVGGLCFNRRPPYSPILVYFTPRGFAFKYDYPEDLVQVDATGAAFLLTKAEVFHKIRTHYNEGPWNILGVGEDVSFCKRATSVGFKVFVDTRVKIGHIGPINVNEKTANRLREFRANPYFEPRPMPAGHPVATIVIPTYNQRPEWLRAAVASAMTQTVPVEIIVVDNGSDDPVTMRDLGWVGHIDGIIDSRFDRVRILRVDQNPGHPFEALNIGIREMTTGYFTWLSSDDLFYPIKVERQIDEMRREDAIASFHSYDVLVEEGRVAQTVIAPYGWKNISDQRQILASGCAINGLTVMIRRDALDAVKLANGDFFDTSFHIAADWELWNRIGKSYLWHGFIGILATRRDYVGGPPMNASQRYARDPKMAALWKAEDDRIRKMYGDQS